MKRLLLALVCVVHVMLLGCKSEPDPTGKWTLAPSGSNNAQINALVQMTGKTYKLDIRKGGIFSIDAFGETGTGEWTFAVDTVRLLITDGFNVVPGQTPTILFILSEDGKTLKWTDTARSSEVTLIREQ